MASGVIMKALKQAFLGLFPARTQSIRPARERIGVSAILTRTAANSAIKPSFMRTSIPRLAFLASLFFVTSAHGKGWTAQQNERLDAIELTAQEFRVGKSTITGVPIFLNGIKCGVNAVDCVTSITTSSASGLYLPLAGGTLSGTMYGNAGVTASTAAFGYGASISTFSAAGSLTMAHQAGIGLQTDGSITGGGAGFTYGVSASTIVLGSMTFGVTTNGINNATTLTNAINSGVTFSNSFYQGYLFQASLNRTVLNVGKDGTIIVPYGVNAATGVFTGDVSAASFTGPVTAGSVDLSTVTARFVLVGASTAALQSQINTNQTSVSASTTAIAVATTTLHSENISITRIDLSTVMAKAGGTFTGQVTLAASTLTVQGSAFSVGVATFTVAGGSATVAYGLTAYTISFTSAAGPLHAGMLTLGTIPNARQDSSSVTLQGNAFNGASQLVQLASNGKLPAIDGSALTNLPSSGGGGNTSSSYTITSTSGLKLVAQSSIATGGWVYVSTDASAANNGSHFLAMTATGYFFGNADPLAISTMPMSSNRYPGMYYGVRISSLANGNNAIDRGQILTLAGGAAEYHYFAFGSNGTNSASHSFTYHISSGTWNTPAPPGPDASWSNNTSQLSFTLAVATAPGVNTDLTVAAINIGTDVGVSTQGVGAWPGRIALRTSNGANSVADRFVINSTMSFVSVPTAFDPITTAADAAKGIFAAAAGTQATIFGAYATTPFSMWIQGGRRDSASVTRDIILQPNGADIGIRTAIGTLPAILTIDATSVSADAESFQIGASSVVFYSTSATINLPTVFGNTINFVQNITTAAVSAALSVTFTSATLGTCLAGSTVTLNMPFAGNAEVTFNGSMSVASLAATMIVGIIVDGAFVNGETATKGLVWAQEAVSSDGTNMSFSTVLTGLTAAQHNICLTASTSAGTVTLDSTSSVAKLSAHRLP